MKELTEARGREATPLDIILDPGHSAKQKDKDETGESQPVRRALGVEGNSEQEEYSVTETFP